MTLEQQLDALIAEHRLSSINLTRIVSSGETFWSVNVQGDGFCAGNSVDFTQSVGEAVRVSIEGLNAKRLVPVIVPEIAALDMAEAAASTTHRGYVIRPHFGPGPSWYYQHKDFDGEGDARFGYGDSWADCAGQIDAHLDAMEAL